MDHLFSSIRKTTANDFRHPSTEQPNSRRLMAPSPSATHASTRPSTARADPSSYYPSPTSPRNTFGAPSKNLAPITRDEFKLLKSEYTYRLPSADVDRNGFIRNSKVLSGAQPVPSSSPAMAMARRGPPAASEFELVQSRQTSPDNDADNVRHRMLASQIAHFNSPILKQGSNAQPHGGRIQEWSADVLKHHPAAGHFVQNTNVADSGERGAVPPVVFVPQSRHYSPPTTAADHRPRDNILSSSAVFSPVSPFAPPPNTTRDAEHEYVPVSYHQQSDGRDFRDITPKRAQRRGERNNSVATQQMDMTPIVAEPAPQMYINSKIVATTNVKEIMSEYSHDGQHWSAVSSRQASPPALPQTPHQGARIVQAIPVEAFDQILMSPNYSDRFVDVEAEAEMKAIVAKYLPDLQKLPQGVAAVAPTRMPPLASAQKKDDASNFAARMVPLDAAPSYDNVYSRIATVRTLVSHRAVEQLENADRCKVAQDESFDYQWIFMKNLKEVYGRMVVESNWDAQFRIIGSQRNADLRRLSTLSKYQEDCRIMEDSSRKNILSQYESFSHTARVQCEQMHHRWVQQCSLLQQELDDRCQLAETAVADIVRIKIALVATAEEHERKMLVTGNPRSKSSPPVLWCRAEGDPEESDIDPLVGPVVGASTSASQNSWVACFTSGAGSRKISYGSSSSGLRDTSIPFYLVDLSIPASCWYRAPHQSQFTFTTGVQDEDHQYGAFHCKCTPLDYFIVIRPILQLVLFETLHRDQVETAYHADSKYRQLLMWHNAQVRILMLKHNSHRIACSEAASRNVIAAEATFLGEKFHETSAATQEYKIFMKSMADDEEQSWAVLISSASARMRHAKLESLQIAKTASVLPGGPVSANTVHPGMALPGSNSGDELFSIADVYGLGRVKLSNIAAVLRMRSICFDLMLISSSYHEVAQPDSTGLTRHEFQQFLATLTASTAQLDRTTTVSAPPSKYLLHSAVDAHLNMSSPLPPIVNNMVHITKGAALNQMPPPPLNPREKQQVLQVFKQFDSKGRGFLDNIEVELALRGVFGGNLNTALMHETMRRHCSVLNGRNYVDLSGFERVFADIL